MHKGEPRIVDKVEDNNFYFRHFNKEKKIVQGVVSIATSKFDEIKKILIRKTACNIGFCNIGAGSCNLHL